MVINRIQALILESGVFKNRDSLGYQKHMSQKVGQKILQTDASSHNFFLVEI
jgi:hypothetical protein